MQIVVGPAWGSVYLSPIGVPGAPDLIRWIAGPISPLLLAVALLPVRRFATTAFVRRTLSIAPGLTLGLSGTPLIFDGLFGDPYSDLARVLFSHGSPLVIRTSCFLGGALIAAPGAALAARGWVGGESRGSVRYLLTALVLVASLSIGLMALNDVMTIRGRIWFPLALELLGALIVVSITMSKAARTESRLLYPARVHASLFMGLVLLGFLTAPSGLWRSRDTSFTQLAAEAEIAFREGRYERAARAYAQLTQVDPHQCYIQLQFGIALVRSGRPEAAEVPLRTILANTIDPGAGNYAPRAHFWLGRIALLAHRDAEACEHFRSARLKAELLRPDEDPAAFEAACLTPPGP